MFKKRDTTLEPVSRKRFYPNLVTSFYILIRMKTNHNCSNIEKQRIDRCFNKCFTNCYYGIHTYWRIWKILWKTAREIAKSD